MPNEFVGERLRVVRQAHGLTLDQLGKTVGVTRQYVQQLELGRRQASADLLDALAQTLEVESSFFEGGPPPDIQDAKCSFRARRSMLVSTRERVRSLSRLLLEVLVELERHVDFPRVQRNIEAPTGVEDAERIATNLRRRLKIPLTSPINNLMRLAESTGAIVASFGDASDKVDAFSVQSRRPVIIYNTRKGSASRTRFDIAHELGHLCMHKDLGSNVDDEEREADRFAGALLMPCEAVRLDFPMTRFKWDTLFALKAKWGISVSALVRRGQDCGVIDALEYRSAQVHIRRRGWHRGEPHEPQDEKPESLALAFEALREGGVAPSVVASRLGMSVPFLEFLTATELVENMPDKIVPIRACKSV